MTQYIKKKSFDNNIESFFSDLQSRVISFSSNSVSTCHKLKAENSTKSCKKKRKALTCKATFTVITISFEISVSLSEIKPLYQSTWWWRSERNKHENVTVAPTNSVAFSGGSVKMGLCWTRSRKSKSKAIYLVLLRYINQFIALFARTLPSLDYAILDG